MGEEAEDVAQLKPFSSRLQHPDTDKILNDPTKLAELIGEFKVIMAKLYSVIKTDEQVAYGDDSKTIADMFVKVKDILKGSIIVNYEILIMGNTIPEDLLSTTQITIGGVSYKIETKEEGDQVTWSPQYPSDLQSVSKIVQNQQGFRDDMSKCPDGYMGFNCADRICPYSLAWIASPYQTADVLHRPGIGGQHSYAECGGVGNCDRTTGVCKCSEGYYGQGCRRRVCPNHCSGHGRCSSNKVAQPLYKKVIQDTSGAIVDLVNFEPGLQLFDSEKSQRCLCDPGYEGYDCSERMCPRGNDALSVCDATSDSSSQTITINTSPVTGDRAYITLEFTDVYGGVAITRPIQVKNKEAQAVASDVTEALVSLPNEMLPTIDVSGTDAPGGNSIRLTLKFVDPSTSGKQNLLKCSGVQKSDMCESGSVPLYQNIGGQVGCAVSHSNSDGVTLKTNDVCGNRGTCDKATGTCKCFPGYIGENCHKPNNNFL